MDDTSLEPYLSPGEKLLWSGRPVPKVRFERIPGQVYVVLLLFLLIFCIPIVLAIGDLLRPPVPGLASTQQILAELPNSIRKPYPITRSQRITKDWGIIVTLGAMVVLLAGTILFTGILGHQRLKATSYAITDRRVLIVIGRPKPIATSILLPAKSEVVMQEWPDGLGSISLGGRPVWAQNKSSFNGVATLENIAEPRKVFQLILEARKSD